MTTDPDFSGPSGPNWGLILAIIASAAAWLAVGLIVGRLWS
jgi:hypothetical protein